MDSWSTRSGAARWCSGLCLSSSKIRVMDTLMSIPHWTRHIKAQQSHKPCAQSLQFSVCLCNPILFRLYQMRSQTDTDLIVIIYLDVNRILMISRPCSLTSLYHFFCWHFLWLIVKCCGLTVCYITRRLSLCLQSYFDRWYNHMIVSVPVRYDHTLCVKWTNT